MLQGPCTLWTTYAFGPERVVHRGQEVHLFLGVDGGEVTHAGGLVGAVGAARHGEATARHLRIEPRNVLSHEISEDGRGRRRSNRQKVLACVSLSISVST